MSADILTVNWGTGQIDLREHKLPMEFKLVEIHHKDDGAFDPVTGVDGPSLVLVLVREGYPIHVIGQVSVRMLAETLGELDYRLERKT